MGEWLGVIMAVVSSALGGTGATVTRYLAVDADPFTLGILRFGFGFLCVLPIAVALRARWPQRKDWLGVASLGILFYGFAIVLYNIALGHTTAARATLALATLPFLTMVVGALLGVESVTARKTVGVVIAMLGVAVGLAAGLTEAPPGAWRGELVMLGTSLCMSFYNVWSRPFIERSSAMGFLTVGMGAGAAVLVMVGLFSGSFAVMSNFGPREWTAGLYLGAAGGALAFVLWVLALQRTSPTRVAITMTANPMAAALLATVLLDEPITISFLIGLVAVLAGIWMASSRSKVERTTGNRS
ncbi:MAG: EamA family transporter [Alphaproteobacteria bacterium]|nr:EamA family transporter [Alphaproteobacteria bacterium]